MTNLTSESLEQVLIKISQALECVVARPTKLIVPKKLLRQAIFIMHSKHKKHMMPTTQRKALKRAKARQHMSFITPRWAI